MKGGFIVKNEERTDLSKSVPPCIYSSTCHTLGGQLGDRGVGQRLAWLSRSDVGGIRRQMHRLKKGLLTSRP